MIQDNQMMITKPDARPASEWLTDVEAAGLVNVSVASLRRWRQLRKGPPYRKLAGHLVRYKRVDLIAWLEACAAGGDTLPAEVA